MLIDARGLSKHIGSKTLFEGLSLHIEEGEKVALIGRNGQGKSTILNILAGADTDYLGTISRQKDLRVVLTSQEHLHAGETTALNYILESVPHYLTYTKIIQQYEEGLHTDHDHFSEAVEYFSTHNYWQIQELIISTLSSFQLTPEQAHAPLNTLSGGEKRFVELTRMMYSRADLLLIDEPTNHMDYVGKAQFIAWLDSITEGCLVVSHDRDVLAHVSRIIELKDGKIYSYPGNYADYLRQNTFNTESSVILYQNQLKRLAEAKKKVDWGLAMRAKSKAWKIRYDHWQRDYDKIKAETVKPSFWIDQDSVQDLDKKVTDSYHQFKEKNVLIRTHDAKEKLSQLLKVQDLSLGYDAPLFKKISFTIGSGDRVFVKGRNGAGKSTLVRTILGTYTGTPYPSTIFAGELVLSKKLVIGEYNQEFDSSTLHLTLEQAVNHAYESLGISIDDMSIKKILSQYLFNPSSDGKLKLSSLSGGQKARFQLIRMLASRPNLLVLDEPTNHLDLPSIEELEKALLGYQGGILYISHDTHFIAKLGGHVVEI